MQYKIRITGKCAADNAKFPFNDGNDSKAPLLQHTHSNLYVKVDASILKK